MWWLPFWYFYFGYFANRKSTFGSLHQVCLFFSCLFIWLWVTFFNVAPVLVAELGKLCGLHHLLSVCKPCQRQLNTWMLCLGCTTQRLAQGAEGLIGGLRIVQLKLCKETSLNYPKLLPCRNRCTSPVCSCVLTIIRKTRRQTFSALFTEKSPVLLPACRSSATCFISHVTD